VQEREGSEVSDALHDLCLSPQIVRVGKSMTMRWAERVERTGRRNIFKGFWWK
jgi:hypothetical protein